MRSMTRYWLTPQTARALLAAVDEDREEVLCSLDLGLTRRHVEVSHDGARLPDAAFPTAQLREVARAKRGVFLLEAGRLEPVQFAAEQFYKLIPTDEAPTLEISGIQMHRTTGTAPFRNALGSARTVVRPGATVLDTCGGLGYTAIAAARLGAASVTSVEVDPNVRAVARQNPWSAEYFAHPAIRLVDDDAEAFVAARPEDSFDRVLHDPPRFSRAGQLYGLAFYRDLARVLRPGGRLFHYTGEPYSRSRGRSFVRGVARRLAEAGFEVQPVERLQGLLGQLR